jgi:hypothetical protein
MSHRAGCASSRVGPSFRGVGTTVASAGGRVRRGLLVGLVGLVGLGMLLPGLPVSAQVREQAPNLVGGELLGRGVILTLNYERFLTNTFGLGAGLMGLGTSDGFVGIVPLYASIVTGDVHSFYASAGTSILFGSGALEDFESEAVGSISLGYQLHSYGGFFVRPLFTMLFNDGDFLVWPGITIGGSF